MRLDDGRGDGLWRLLGHCDCRESRRLLGQGRLSRVIVCEWGDIFIFIGWSRKDRLWRLHGRREFKWRNQQQQQQQLRRQRRHSDLWGLKQQHLQQQ